jgi:hypothetical protein
MTGRDAKEVVEGYSALRRARDPRRRLSLATQLLELLGAIESAVSAIRDDAVSQLRSAGASYGEIAELAGVNRSRAAQLAHRTLAARGKAANR